VLSRPFYEVFILVELERKKSDSKYFYFTMLIKEIGKNEDFEEKIVGFIAYNSE
jgi:hypothetical protein